MKARIYRPSRSTMSSGRAKTKKWVLEYELISKRQPEPLMGWVSSEDTLNQVQIFFETKDEAIRFAEKKGLEYECLVDQDRSIPPKNYAQNFQ